MNSRERIITTLNHKEPDKVPIDLNGTNCTSLTKVDYNSLREYLVFTKYKNPNISTFVINTFRAK